MNKNTYWNGNGKHTELASQLQRMIPREGMVANPKKNKKLEKFRKAVNCYYDLYNNGLCNHARAFCKVFAIPSSPFRLTTGNFMSVLYAETEKAMDKIVLDAALEQGLIDPNLIDC